jgi:hypothetical protein
MPEVPWQPGRSTHPYTPTVLGEVTLSSFRESELLSPI